MRLVAAVILATDLSGTGGSQIQPMALGSLRPGCTLEKRWVGAVPALPWGVFLKCGSTSFLVTHPLNLLRHVQIQTADEALEYARFFSNADSYDLFHLGGMVEVLPGRVTGDSRFNELDPTIFAKLLRPAAARRLQSSAHSREVAPQGCCQGSQFEVKRVMLLPDQSVREIVEVVFEDGYYSIASREVLIKDAGSIGLQYFWLQ
jgi:hypothetical protein